MMIEEAIEREEALAYSFGERWKRLGEPVGDLPKLEEEHRQMAEWLRELKALKDFANFVAESVLEEDFEESSDFYAEAFCRKLHKMGFIEATDDKWILNEEVNADADSD